MSKPCCCGSGKESYWISDARGIPVARACEDCESSKKSGYRPEVFADSHYAADEPIEEEV